MLAASDPDRIDIALTTASWTTRACCSPPRSPAGSASVNLWTDPGDAPGRANAGDKLVTLVASALAGAHPRAPATLGCPGGTFLRLVASAAVRPRDAPPTSTRRPRGHPGTALSRPRMARLRDAGRPTALEGASAARRRRLAAPRRNSSGVLRTTAEPPSNQKPLCHPLTPQHHNTTTPSTPQHHNTTTPQRPDPAHEGRGLGQRWRAAVGRVSSRAPVGRHAPRYSQIVIY